MERSSGLWFIGSVTNMIVVEFAREHLEIGFWDYARVRNPDYDPDDCCLYPCAARVALRNRLFFAGARQVRAGAVKALLRLGRYKPLLLGSDLLRRRTGYTASVTR